jgi:hypothetical protein
MRPCLRLVWLPAGVCRTADPRATQVYFIPSFFVADTRTLSQYTSTDGDFDWDGSWPKGPGPVTFDIDQQHIAGNGRRFFMASVSPWFFAVRQSRLLRPMS